MKTYIKSSFLTVLLMAVFTVGFSSASAKTNKTTTNGKNAVAIQTVNQNMDLICFVGVYDPDTGTVVLKQIPCPEEKQLKQS